MAPHGEDLRVGEIVISGWQFAGPYFFVAPQFENPSLLAIIDPNRYICSGTAEIVPDGG